MNQRRELVIALGASALVVPLAAHAQPQQVWRIGVLSPYSSTDREAEANVAAFREGLQKLGWVEGRNMRMDIRSAAFDAGAVQRLAKELVALQPELILVLGTNSTAALLQQTRTIPIVFLNVGDPIGSGFIASFRQPGGNVTGFIPMEGSVAGKWLELLKEIAPRVNHVAFLFNPAMAPNFEHFLNPLKAAAQSIGVEVIAAPVRDKSELESVIATQARASDGGLVLMPDSFNIGHSEEIALLANRYRLPAIYPFRFFVEHGGLMAYGNDRNDNARRAAAYADLILKGAKPADLPVQAPIKYELVINLRTAKALGLTVPQSLVLRADLIE